MSREFGNDGLRASDHELTTPKRTVGDYVILQRGTTYSGSLVGEPGPALLGLGSIEPGGGFRQGQYKTYGGDCPENLMLYPGDIYAALKGATKDGKMIGSVARVPASVPSGRLTQDTVKLIFKDPEPEESKYLYWILRTPQYRSYCEGHAMGSAVVALSRRDFLAFPVPPPNAERENAISLLEHLEEKIELNRQMNETLEAMAQALFKAWFVDFEPVRAKAEGRDPGLPRHLVDLFPDSLEDSDFGEIPKGWEVRGLDEIARFTNGLAMQRYPPTDEDSLSVIKIAQLRAGSTSGADRARADLAPEYIVQDGDILFSWSGSLECVLWAGGPGALNQHLFKVTSESYPRWLCYLGIHQYLEAFRQIAASKATTMGHIQRHHLSEAKIAVPPLEVLEAMDRFFQPVVESTWKRAVQSRTLAALRDTLLPKLLSGELRVKDAERRIEEIG